MRQLQLRGEVQSESVTVEVRLDSLTHAPVRSCGVERLALQSLEALEFPRLLLESGLSERDARIAMALVMARMAAPASGRAAVGGTNVVP